MPIHDWTRIHPGMFHAFHVQWLTAISNALNEGILPPDHFAVPEHVAAKYQPDVLTLRHRNVTPHGRTAAATAPVSRLTERAKPRTRLKPPRRHIAIKHVSGNETVAVVELVSPGNKKERAEFDAFLTKSIDLIRQRIHLVIADLFPPTRRDPHGIHAVVWRELTGKRSAPPADKPLTFVGYEADVPVTAYIEPAAVGDPVPDVPLFLAPGRYVICPLAAAYDTAWRHFPEPWKPLVELAAGEPRS